MLYNCLSFDVCRFFFFFFQAEDGIRDGHVTGVQTCALPIFPPARPAPVARRRAWRSRRLLRPTRAGSPRRSSPRSEERRVGKSVDLGGRRIIKKKKKK